LNNRDRSRGIYCSNEKEREARTMTLMAVTWKRILKLWWAIFWRGWIFGIPLAIIVGFTYAFISGLVGAEPSKRVIEIFAAIVGIIVNVAVTKWVVSKTKFSDFKIALIKG